MCLRYIAKALERDPTYVKALAFMDRIFSEQPSLRRDSLRIFESCDSAIYDTTVDDDEAEEVRLKTSLTLSTNNTLLPIFYTMTDSVVAWV